MIFSIFMYVNYISYANAIYLQIQVTLTKKLQLAVWKKCLWRTHVVTSTKESSHTYEWVMLHLWMSHVHTSMYRERWCCLLERTRRKIKNDLQYICMYTHIYIYIWIYICTMCIHIYIHIFLNVYMYICVHIYTMLKYINVHMYSYLNEFLIFDMQCIYIYTFIAMHMWSFVISMFWLTSWSSSSSCLLSTTLQQQQNKTKQF